MDKTNIHMQDYFWKQETRDDKKQVFTQVYLKLSATSIDYYKKETKYWFCCLEKKKRRLQDYQYVGSLLFNQFQFFQTVSIRHNKENYKGFILHRKNKRKVFFNND